MRFCEHPKCKYPVFGTDKVTGKGYCKSHQTQRTDFDRRTIIQKAMDKQKGLECKVRSLGANIDRKDNERLNELAKWFKDRRNDLKGVCSHCGDKSSKDNDRYFKHSIAHILPKAYFKSVATHPDNWIELCFFKNSCHSQMDNKMLDLIDMNCFDEIVTKVAKMYPSIAQEERKRIPKILLEYIEIEK